MAKSWRCALTVCALFSVLGSASGQSQGLYDPGAFRSINLEFKQSDWFDQILQNKAKEIYIKADMQIDGTWYRDVGVRGRGATVWAGTLNMNSKKIPFKISTDEFVTDQEVLGYKNLVLNNGYRDPTFLREALALRTMREFVKAPEANLVNLTINGENWGVYVNIQPIDSTFIKGRFRNNDGHRYKGAHDLKYYGPDPKDWEWPIRLLTPKNATAYHDLIKAMETTTLPVNQRLAEVPKLIDVDSVHRHLAVNSLIGNSDGAPKSNYYLYTDPYHEQLYVIPWDLNVSFIGRSNGMDMAPKIFGEAGIWHRRYLGHLRTGVDRVLNWQTIGAWATQWHTMIDSAVKADPKKLYSYADFRDNLANSSAYITPSIKISSLRRSVEGRYEYFRKHAPMTNPRVTLSDPGHAPMEPRPTEAVRFAIKAQSSAKIHRVLLHHRTRGHYQEAEMKRAVGGKDRNSDGVFVVTLPPMPAGQLVSYYFSAETDAAAGGDVNFYPFNGAHNPRKFMVTARLNTVLINEFCAKNKHGIQDSNKDHDDWIEILNPTDTAQDLSGFHLTDNAAKPTKWQFPAGTIVPAKETILVWADNEPAQGPLHTNFRLRASGEEIALFDPQGKSAIDLVTFGKQKKNISTGRLFDKVSPSVTYSAPTPRGKNELDPCGFRSWFTRQHGHHSMLLTASGSTRPGDPVTIQLTNAPANFIYLIQFAFEPDIVQIHGLGIWRLIGPVANTCRLPTDAWGESSFQFLTPSSSMWGYRLSMQAISHDRTRFLASNGLEIGICR